MNRYKKLVPGILLALSIATAGCQKPEAFTPSAEKDGINTLTAYFLDDTRSENVFQAEIDHDKRTISVVFPYNYPRTSYDVLPMSALSKVKVIAEIDNNTTIEPALGIMDLTKEQTLTITTPLKEKKQYTIVGVIRKNNEAMIKEFTVADPKISGIIDESSKTIALVHSGEIGLQNATVVTSHGATLDPDPTTTPIDFDAEPKITVTAQNGTDKSVYTIVKRVPPKVDRGIREGSGKLLWAKSLQSDLGIAELHLTGGIAYSDGKVIVNTRNQPSIILNAKNGEKLGTITTMSGIVGGLTNFYSTSDAGGHILVNNLAPGGGTFKVWCMKDVNSTPEVLIDWSGSGGYAVGRKVSVAGDITKDALITAVIHGDKARFARWQIKDGQLLSQTPDLVLSNALTGAWWNNSDVVYSDPTNPASDYFMAAYAPPRRIGWIDGTTHNRKANGPEISGNWIMNAVDYVPFNGAAYAATSSINSFTWGSDDIVYLHDASTPESFSEPIWKSKNGVFGGKDNGGQNANGTGDVLLQVSEDGYYLYLFFMFTNGQVACVQFDCIDK